MDFPGIPQGFRHLQLVVYARCDQAAVQQDQLYLQMNGDGGANYSWQTCEGFDSSAIGNASIADNSGIRVGELPAAAALANAFGLTVIDVPYYTTTVAFKSVISHGQNARLGTAAVLDQKLCGGWWASMAAITRLTLSMFNADNFITGSIASLYGIA